MTYLWKQLEIKQYIKWRSPQHLRHSFYISAETVAMATRLRKSFHGVILQKWCNVNAFHKFSTYLFKCLFYILQLNMHLLWNWTIFITDIFIGLFCRYSVATELHTYWPCLLILKFCWRKLMYQHMKFKCHIIVTYNYGTL